MEQIVLIANNLKGALEIFLLFERVGEDVSEEEEVMFQSVTETLETIKEFLKAN